MEFLAIVVSVVSITTNYLMLRKISNLEINVFIPEPEPVELPTHVTLPNKVTVPETSPTTKDESHYAWKNQNNIPIGPSRPAPPNVSVPQTSGPLERPAGFYR